MGGILPIRENVHVGGLELRVLRTGAPRALAGPACGARSRRAFALCHLLAFALASPTEVSPSAEGGTRRIRMLICVQLAFLFPMPLTPRFPVLRF